MLVESAEKVRSLVEAHSDFLCVAHQDADADSLGSVLAFSEYLVGRGKRAYPWVPDPLPRSLSYLPGYDTVNTQAAPPDAVALAFDAGSPERFGNLGPRIEAAPLTAVFDHHTSNSGFGDVCVLDREAAATGVIVFRVLREWEAEISPSMATNLYAAIYTDTGGFRHDNTDAYVLHLGAELADLGADPAMVALKSYKSRSQSTLRLHALASAAAHYEFEGRLIWTEVTQQMLRQAGALMEESEGVIDFLQSLDVMEVAILFKEAAPALTKVSTRTRGSFAAHELVGALGGGGHRRAAGAAVPRPIQSVESEMLEQVRALLAKDETE